MDLSLYSFSKLRTSEEVVSISARFQLRAPDGTGVVRTTGERCHAASRTPPAGLHNQSESRCGLLGARPTFAEPSPYL